MVFEKRVGSLSSISHVMQPKVSLAFTGIKPTSYPQE